MASWYSRLSFSNCKMTSIVHLSPQLLILCNLSTWLNSKYCIGKTWWNLIDCNACCVGVTAIKITFLCCHCCYYVVLCERKDYTTNFTTQGFIQTTRFFSHTSQINLSDLLTDWTIWHIFQPMQLTCSFPQIIAHNFFSVPCQEAYNYCTTLNRASMAKIPTLQSFTCFSFLVDVFYLYLRFLRGET